MQVLTAASAAQADAAAVWTRASTSDELRDNIAALNLAMEKNAVVLGDVDAVLWDDVETIEFRASVVVGAVVVVVGSRAVAGPGGRGQRERPAHRPAGD